jgi:hypothetical protein
MELLRLDEPSQNEKQEMRFVVALASPIDLFFVEDTMDVLDRFL